MPTPPRSRAPQQWPRSPDLWPPPLPDLTAIRLSTVPDCAPPFDDRSSRIPDSPQQRLPLRGPSPDAARTDAGAPSQPTRRGGRMANGSTDGRAQRGAADTPPPTRRRSDDDRRGREPVTGGSGRGEWPGRFAQVLAETLAGTRPASQMTTWTTQRARERIRRLGPLLAAEQRPRVRRLIASQPTDDVLEVAAVVGFGPRTRAMAARFERVAAQPAAPGRAARPARWLCTDIESA